MPGPRFSRETDLPMPIPMTGWARDVVSQERGTTPLICGVLHATTGALVGLLYLPFRVTFVGVGVALSHLFLWPRSTWVSCTIPRADGSQPCAACCAPLAVLVTFLFAVASMLFVVLHEINVALFETAAMAERWFDAAANRAAKRRGAALDSRGTARLDAAQPNAPADVEAGSTCGTGSGGGPPAAFINGLNCCC